jgi:hypothetical protein
MDSKSVRAADTVPCASWGWDAAEKVNCRKLHRDRPLHRTGHGRPVLCVIPAALRDRRIDLNADLTLTLPYLYARFGFAQQ